MLSAAADLVWGPAPASLQAPPPLDGSPLTFTGSPVRFLCGHMARSAISTGIDFLLNKASEATYSCTSRDGFLLLLCALYQRQPSIVIFKGWAICMQKLFTVQVLVLSTFMSFPALATLRPSAPET